MREHGGAFAVFPVDIKQISARTVQRKDDDSLARMPSSQLIHQRVYAQEEVVAPRDDAEGRTAVLP
jgi:hypothetical protein